MHNFSADSFSSAQSKGAKEKIVTRIIVSRCEVDLKKICSEYKHTFGQSLQQTITVSSLLLIKCKAFSIMLPSPYRFFPSLQEHTKGDYQKALLGLCGPEQ
ncbi:hypothetical protein ILYODFUR_020391 [Ilyodon furcidens]|uniref:Uncharacterized protein n=1 Tax=Ilyodon furcidens TaxID=33524 RepID=A0ABV0SZS5_9TELE